MLYRIFKVLISPLWLIGFLLWVIILAYCDLFYSLFKYIVKGEGFGDDLGKILDKVDKYPSL